MVDTPPVDPNATPAVTPFIPTPDQTLLVQNYTAAVQDNITAQGSLDTVLNNVRGAMDLLNQRLTDAGTNMTSLTSLTDNQLDQFTVLTAGVVKARDAFQGLSGISFENLSTFTEQINDLKAALASGSTAASGLSGMIGVLGKQLIDAGVPQTAINAAFQQGTGAVLNLAQGLLTHADNMLKAQSVTIQLAASTGNLGDVWSAAGDDLKNINTLLATQTTMIADSTGATGLSAKQVEEYYAQLGQIPGALNATVTASEKGGEQTSMLTAAIEVATGTGRKYADVMTDLKTAFQAYGLVGENALRFSTRMSDVSSRLKAPIDDVTKSLRNSASAFQMFATGQENAASSAESLAKTLNSYGKALESTGLSATAAVEVAGNLSNQVSKLSTGQLAFISQRTGGAGGLQGAAQETLKLQTDPGAVVKDAMDTLKQQFGRIVTVQEAATSESAASQNIKQTALLQQLLGPLAKDQATANRLLEAMKNQDAGQQDAVVGALDELKPTSVQDAAAKGVKIQEGSYSELTKIRSQLERMRYIADQGAGRALQTALTARGGIAPGLAQGEMSTNLRQSMHANMARGGTQVQSTAEGIRTGNVADKRGVEAAGAIREAASTLKDIPLTMRAIGETMHSVISSGNVSPSSGQQVGANVIASSGQMVGTAATTAAAMPPGIPNMQGAGTGATPAFVPGANSGPGTLHVTGKITIDCPHCGRPTDSGNNLQVYTGPNGQSGQ